jgi:hypothetical protein
MSSIMIDILGEVAGCVGSVSTKDDLLSAISITPSLSFGPQGMSELPKPGLDLVNQHSVITADQSLINHRCCAR